MQEFILLFFTKIKYLLPLFVVFGGIWIIRRFLRKQRAKEERLLSNGPKSWQELLEYIELRKKRRFPEKIVIEVPTIQKGRFSVEHTGKPHFIVGLDPGQYCFDDNGEQEPFPSSARYAYGSSATLKIVGRGKNRVEITFQSLDPEKKGQYMTNVLRFFLTKKRRR